MSKVRNVKVRVSPPSDGENPYKKGTHKYDLFQWALEQGEFTKIEFLTAEKEIFDEKERTSAMTDEIRGKAWWNEFYNKYNVFTYAE